MTHTLHPPSSNVGSPKAGSPKFWMLAIAGVVVVAILVRVAMTFGLFGGGGGWGAGPMAVDVLTEPVKIQTVMASYRTSGTLESFANVTLKAESEGRVVRIAFQEGQSVSKGAPLIQIDPALQMAELQQSRANTHVASSEIQMREKEQVQRNADLAAQKARLDLAKSEYARYQSLYAKEFISAMELDQKHANLQTAQADYDAILARERAMSSSIEQARASLSAQSASQLNTQVRVQKTMLRAPFAGTVGQKMVDLGDYVQMGTPLVSVVQTSPLKVTFSVPQRYLHRVSSGATVYLAPYREGGMTESGQELMAKVIFVDPQVSADTRTVTVKALVDGSQQVAQNFRPGEFVDVRLVLESHPDALVIPEAAIIPRGERQYVYRIEKDKAFLHPVVVGERYPGQVEILDGLNSKDRVVVGGIQKLQDGAPIREKKPEDQDSKKAKAQ